MSVKATTWVWHDPATSGLKGNAVLALLALADIADDEGYVIYARPDDRSQAKLAAKARMSVATFRRVTGDLAEAGLLEVSRESQRAGNEYRIRLTAHSERSPLSAVTAQIEQFDRSPVSGRTPLTHEHVSNVLELVPPGTSERGSFDEFWEVYPRRVGKEAARRAFASAARKAGTSVVIDGARRFAADPNLPEKQYVPHPATWLSRGSWDDEPLPARVAVAAGAAAPLASEYDAADSWMAFNR